MDCFRRLMNDPLFDDLPLILETPGVDSYAKQIKLLRGLIRKGKK